MSLIKSILHLGLRPGQTPVQQRLIKLTTRVNLMFLTVSFLVLPLFDQVAADVVWLGYVNVGINVLALVFNANGYYTLARLMICFFSVASVSLNIAFALVPGSPIPAAHYALLIVLYILPFILFDSRQRGLIILSLVLTLPFFFTLPQLNTLLMPQPSWEMFKDASSAPIQFIIGVVAISVLFSLLLLLNQGIVIEKRRVEKAVKEAEESRIQAETSRMELERTFRQLEQAKQEDEKRNWVSESIAHISTLMRGDREEIHLYDVLLSQLIRMIEADLGAIYIVQSQQEGPGLKMQACYAYGRKKFLQKTIDPGEGLVGQCLLEKAPIILTKVPKGYLTIRSGLGEATPRMLLLFPLLNNEQVEGVLEIASFQELPSHKIGFLEKAAEIIASYVASKRITLQNRQFLDDANQQRQALQAQEEEMRQNFEELQATQEEMRRKEKQYLATIQQLQQKR